MITICKTLYYERILNFNPSVARLRSFREIFYAILRITLNNGNKYTMDTIQLSYEP